MFIIIILPIKKKNLINQLDHCDNNVLSRNILAERQVMGMTHHGKMGEECREILAMGYSCWMVGDRDISPCVLKAFGERLTQWALRKWLFITSTGKWRWSILSVSHTWESIDSREDTMSICKNLFLLTVTSATGFDNPLVKVHLEGNNPGFRAVPKLASQPVQEPARAPATQMTKSDRKLWSSVAPAE